jgi:hypothetical protein
LTILFHDVAKFLRHLISFQKKKKGGVRGGEVEGGRERVKERERERG